MKNRTVFSSQNLVDEIFRGFSVHPMTYDFRNVKTLVGRAKIDDATFTDSFHFIFSVDGS